MFIAIKKILNAAQRVQFFCPFEESEPERLLKRERDFNEYLWIYLFIDKIIAVRPSNHLFLFFIAFKGKS